MLLEQMRAAGAHCKSKLCVLCGGASDGDCATTEQGDDLPTRTFRVALRSTFCLEPAGDDLTRTHFFAAVQAGCLPVLFDGGGANGYDDEHPRMPTNYAWRGILNYSAFSVSFSTRDLRPARRRSTDADEPPNVFHVLRRLADDAPRLAAMRAALRDVLPIMRFTTRDCGAPRCDAFAMLGATLKSMRTAQLNTVRMR